MDGTSLPALGRDARHVEVGRVALTAPLRCTAVVGALIATSPWADGQCADLAARRHRLDHGEDFRSRDRPGRSAVRPPS